MEILSRNHVNITGNGKQPMMFAHGYGCDQTMWRYVVPSFVEDYRAVLFDYVGCGKSDYRAYDQEKYRTLHGYAQDVLDICETLNLTDVVFVGHSVGSMIGVLASLQRPDLFSRLILIGPSPCYINEKPSYIGGFEREDMQELLALMDHNFESWAGKVAPAIMGSPDRPELARELEESFCLSDPVIARQFARVTFLSDNRSDLPRVSVPSLILQCSQDIIAPLEVGAYMNLHMPNNTLQFMEATGHCPHLSYPDETVRLIKDYLAQQ